MPHQSTSSQKWLCAHREQLAEAVLFLFILSPIFQLLYCFLHSGDAVFSGDLFYTTLVQITTVCAFVIGIFAFAAAYLDNRPGNIKVFFKNVPARLPFLFLCLWMVLVTCINGFTDAALTGDSYRGESLFSFVTYFALYFLCGTLIKSESVKHRLIYGFLIVNTIVNLVTLFDYFISPLAIFKMNETFSSIFYQFNHYGYFLLFGTILSATLLVVQSNWKQNIFPVVTLVLNTLLLSINNTFGCFLSCIVTLTLLVVAESIRRKRFNTKALGVWVAFLLISFTIGARFSTYTDDCVGFLKDIGAVFGVSDSTHTDEEAKNLAANAGTGRWTLWTHTAGYIAEKPLFGWGVEGINSRLEAETNGVNSRPHNEYLQYAAFFGIPGALLYLAGLVLVAWRALKRFRSLDNATFICLVATFAYLFSAMFGNTMFYTAPFLFIFMGLSCSFTPTSATETTTENNTNE